MKIEGDYKGDFTAIWQIPVLQDDEIQKELLAIGEGIKAKYWTDFEALKAPYAGAVMKTVPPHLRKVKAYELQSVFCSDGWFLMHCITALLENGKLKAPAREQRKSLTTLITNV